MCPSKSHFQSESYILIGNPKQQDAKAKLIIANAKTHFPEQFEGNRDSFTFELRYTPQFDKNFIELKRLQGTAAAAAGRRDEFRGYIIIDISSYLSHHNEDYFNKSLLFLIDMSEYWKYIFLVNNQNSKHVRELVGKVLSVFIPNNISCEVIRSFDERDKKRKVDDICTGKNVVCSAHVKELLQELFAQDFSEDIISSFLVDIAWHCGKRIDWSALYNYIHSSDSIVQYMLTQKEYIQLVNTVEHWSETINAEKEAI